MSSYVVQFVYHLRDKMSGQLRKIKKAQTSANQGFRKAVTDATAAAAAARKLGNEYDRTGRKATTLAIKMKSLSGFDRRMSSGGMLGGIGGGMLSGGIVRKLYQQSVAINSVWAKFGNETMKGASFKDGKFGKTDLNGLNIRETLDKEVSRIASVSKYDYGEVAAGLYEIASAGVGAKDALTMLHPAMRLAGATGSSGGFAVDKLTNIMKSYGIEMSKAADISDLLAHAVAGTNFELTDLASALKYAAPSDKMGLGSLKRTTSLLMTMSQVGMKGSMGGTTAARMMERIYQAADSKKTKGLLSNVGMTKADFLDEEGRLKDQGTILQKWQDALKKYGYEKVVTAIQSLYGSRGGRGVKKLMGQNFIDLIKKNENYLNNAKGRAAAMEKENMEGVAGAVNKFVASWSDLVKDLGSAGLNEDIKEISRMVRELMLDFKELLPHQKKMIARIFLFVSALSMVAIPLGMVIFGIGQLLSVVAGASSFLGITSLLGMLKSHLFGMVGAINKVAGPFAAFSNILLGITKLIGIGAIAYLTPQVYDLARSFGFGEVSSIAFAASFAGLGLAAVLNMGKVISVLGTVSKAVWALGWAMRGLMIASGIGLFLAAILLIHENFEWVKNAVQPIIDTMKEWFNWVAGGFSNIKKALGFGENSKSVVPTQAMKAEASRQARNFMITGPKIGNLGGGPKIYNSLGQEETPSSAISGLNQSQSNLAVHSTVTGSAKLQVEVTGNGMSGSGSAQVPLSSDNRSSPPIPGNMPQMN